MGSPSRSGVAHVRLLIFLASYGPPTDATNYGMGHSGGLKRPYMKLSTDLVDDAARTTAHEVSKSVANLYKFEHGNYRVLLKSGNQLNKAKSSDGRMRPNATMSSCSMLFPCKHAYWFHEVGRNDHFTCQNVANFQDCVNQALTVGNSEATVRKTLYDDIAFTYQFQFPTPH